MVPTATATAERLGFDDLVASFGETLAGAADPASTLQARDRIEQLEVLRRQIDAASVDLLATIDSGGLHWDDGHVSPKVMMRHRAKLSGSEALARERTRKMMAELTSIAHSYRQGDIGTEQARLLARIYSNRRVQDAMVDRQDWFISLAKKLPYPRFEARVRNWESLTDQDGAEPANDRTYENRNAQLVQNHFDKSWDLQGILSALDGAAFDKVFRAYIEAEFQLDYAALTDKFGKDAPLDLMARTDAQRRADALMQMAADAAANPDGAAPMGFIHTVNWSESTYDEMANRFDGHAPQPFDLENYQCETADGVPLEPYEAFANSLCNRIRRMIFDAKSVVTDLGEARFFRGNARDAAHAGHTHCYWPGCWVPASAWETDHLHDHGKDGRTNPGNGAPACGRHNRWKQKGYRVWRDDTGRIRIMHPNGTEVE